MGVHSGRFGAVNGQGSVRNWSITESRNDTRQVASNTKNGTVRRNGIEDWNGSFSQYGGKPSVFPGDAFAFLGYTAPSDNTPGANGTRYSGNSICNQIVINWDWAGANVINSQISFEADGALTVASGAAVTDATSFEAESPCGVIWEYSADGDTWTELTDLVSGTLTFTIQNSPYVNSSTLCKTKRRAGAALDFTVSAVQQNTVRQLTPGDDIYLRCYVDDTDFWLLQWCKVGAYTGLTVDRETGAIISQTINLSMNGIVGGVVGEIILPGEATAEWPAS